MSTHHRFRANLQNTERHRLHVHGWREERSRGKYVVNHLAQELRPSGLRHPSRNGNVSGGSEVEALTYFGGAALLRPNQTSFCMPTIHQFKPGEWKADQHFLRIHGW
ncbi:hypothetical protein M407DRAFT_31399 [Tulasnella calospora MUT 4182]|uniref:Uncharacterized protein n=1 Tax=Tulasnella calospora MUT 4182 TaxID=1051891 RepID=A0A0C3KBW1_9AGAM|nr:hypothetical protein M407DRAFT_31399 [Tulasnella calospora MUT 4182]